MQDNHIIFQFLFNRDIPKIKELLEEDPSIASIKDNYGYNPLHHAAKLQLTEIVELLLKFGIKIDCRTYSGETPFFLACANDNVPLLEMLLKSGADIHAKNHQGCTPLMKSCENQAKDNALFLIKNGAKVNELGGIKKSTPLMYAALTNDVLICEILLNNNAYIDARNNEGNTALIIAVKMNYFEVVEFLVISGANLYIKDLKGRTALIWSIINMQENIIPFLVNKMENVKGLTAFGLNALHYAAFSDFSLQINALLEKGIGINETTSEGYTSLMLATYKTNVKFASELINAGADFNAKDLNGNTALHYAIISPEIMNAETVQFLLEKGANVNAVSLNGKTALMESVYLGDDYISEILCEYGADINLFDNELQDALMYACLNGYDLKSSIALNIRDPEYLANSFNNLGQDELFETSSTNCYYDITCLLLEKGAEINRYDINGDTPLHLACRYGNIEIVKKLLELGSEINSQNYYGITPLMYACMDLAYSLFDEITRVTVNTNIRLDLKPDNKRKEDIKNLFDIVILLIQKGADINIQTYSGLTALMVACKYKREDIALLLLEKNANLNVVDNKEKTYRDYASEKDLKKVLDFRKRGPARE